MAEENNKKKTEEIEDKIGRERGKLGEDAQVKKKSKKQRIDSETENDGKKLKKANKEKRIDSEGDDGVKEKSKKKKKKKNKEIKVDSEAEDGVKEKLKKKNNETMVDSEAEDGVKNNNKKKKKKKESEVDVIGNSERSKVCEKPLVGNADANKKKGKRKRDETDLEAEENSEDKEMMRKITKKKKPSEDSKADENNKDSTTDAKKEKKKKKKQRLHSEVKETSLNSTEGAKEYKPSEDSEVVENIKDSTKDADKEKKEKVKQSVDSEVDETSFNFTEDTKKENKQIEDSEVEENIKDSKKDAKKQKKKKTKQSVDSEVEDIKLKSTENAKKKGKEKKRTKDSEAEENNLNSTKDSKKKRKQSKFSEVEENNKDSTKDAKKKSKGKKRNEDSEAEENNNDSTKDAKKKTKKKQESGNSDKDVATPSSKSTKRVKFSDQVEVFESEDEEEVKLVRGKRYSKEEDALIKGSVLEYIDNHALGDGGIKMVMECKSHPQIKGCWKEIASAIPWRTYDSVYNRAHTLFEAGSRGVWTKEDLELVREFQKKHGNDWRTLADAMGKHRKHVKDAWRRVRLSSKKKGHWMREEYQALFDLVNKDIRMKAFQEKRSKHGMLRDNIPWMAISDELGSRDHVTCCSKWYDQLQSPMIAKGIWANVDDYRLLEELLKLDAACIDDVDWDNLLDNRDEEACRKRWNQMVLHIGSPRSKTFAEQVEILSERYCPDIAEDREDFDNRPYDPED